MIQQIVEQMSCKGYIEMHRNVKVKPSRRKTSSTKSWGRDTKSPVKASKEESQTKMSAKLTWADLV